MLQHGRNVASRKNITRQQQHRQTIDSRSRSARQHIRCARPDRCRAHQRPQPVAHLRERSGGVHHRLFVAAQVIREVRVLLQRLAHAGNIAVSEDTEATGKEILFPSIARHALRFQKSDDGLCGS